MSKALEELALRKEVLRARSALYRLEIRRELWVVSDTLQWARAGVQVAASLPVRTGLLGLALQTMGHGRVARLIAFASRVIFFAKVTGIVVDVLRRRPRRSRDE